MHWNHGAGCDRFNPTIRYKMPTAATMNSTHSPARQVSASPDVAMSGQVADERELSDAQQIGNIVDSATDFQGPERRASRRIPRTLEISVQPLDEQLEEAGRPFFAITRDISQGGLSFLSSQRATFKKAVVSINDGIAPGIVCRICNSSVIHSSGSDDVCLTNVEFLFVHKRRKS